MPVLLLLVNLIYFILGGVSIYRNMKTCFFFGMRCLYILVGHMYVYMYCHLYECVTIDGVWLGEWI
jgi:hypothetical protein